MAVREISKEDALFHEVRANLISLRAPLDGANATS
jgi:hypothetical protein